MIQYIIKKERTDVGLNEIDKALYSLNAISLKLYIYLLRNPETEFLYTRLNFVNVANTTIKSADQAFNELIENHFLIKKNDLTYFFNPLGENIKS